MKALCRGGSPDSGLNRPGHAFRRALDRLVERGLVERISVADGTVLYGKPPRQREMTVERPMAACCPDAPRRGNIATATHAAGGVPPRRLRRRSPGPDAGRSTSAAILCALSLLDVRLSAAADAIRALFGPESSRDMFRGLHIKPTDVDMSLGRAPVAPLFGPLGFGRRCSAEWLRDTRFERLREVVWPLFIRPRRAPRRLGTGD